MNTVNEDLVHPFTKKLHMLKHANHAKISMIQMTLKSLEIIKELTKL